jgi:hypothetical protein
MAEHTQGKVRLARMETADELAKLKGVTLAPHEGWFRDNDGSWLVVTDDGRLCTVKFRGTAKRGQAHQAEDPEGLANAKRIVALWNAFEGVETSAIEAGAVAALVRAAVEVLEGFKEKPGVVYYGPAAMPRLAVRERLAAALKPFTDSETEQSP